MEIPFFFYSIYLQIFCDLAIPNIPVGFKLSSKRSMAKAIDPAE